MRPTVGEALVRLPHREMFIEATKLGFSLQSPHQNIVRIEEEQLVKFLEINRAVAPREAVNGVPDKRRNGVGGRYGCGNIGGAGD